MEILIEYMCVIGLKLLAIISPNNLQGHTFIEEYLRILGGLVSVKYIIRIDVVVENWNTRPVDV
jgi:hypothetical protein